MRHNVLFYIITIMVLAFNNKYGLENNDVCLGEAFSDSASSGEPCRGFSFFYTAAVKGVSHLIGKIFERLNQIGGKVGFYYKNLVTGEEFAYNENLSLVAASVIKIPVLIDVFYQITNGQLDKNEMFTIQKSDKLPSCGALTYMHDGLQVTLKDLYTLMIILSDNTATNLLIKRLGIEHINQTMHSVGLAVTSLNRLLFDSAEQSKGKENYICAKEVGLLLEKMYHGKLISPPASQEMLRILGNQRLNGKIPFWVPSEIHVAHKTGEDSGITHDVGIVYAAQPFVICFCANEVEVPQFERAMQDITKNLLEMQGIVQ